MDRKRGNCVVCGQALNKGEPVLVEMETQGLPTRWIWTSLPEWGPSTDRYTHPECFGRERGVTALVDAIQENYLRWAPYLRQARDDGRQQRMSCHVPDSEPMFQALEEIKSRAISDGRLSLAAMIRTWGSDVRRFFGEVHATPIRDALARNADDYIGALTMRSMIEDERDQIPKAFGFEFDQLLARIDSEFLAFTIPDDGGLLAAWIHEEVPNQWWWHRIPPSGVVLEDLSRD